MARLGYRARLLLAVDSSSRAGSGSRPRDGPGDWIEREGGVGFAGDDKPDELDFAYFAFTIGMCFQVSDATITDRVIRRTALLHALVSFAYNTGILALVLNIVMAQLG